MTGAGQACGSIEFIDNKLKEYQQAIATGGPRNPEARIRIEIKVGKKDCGRME